MDALLVIDMQNGIFDASIPRFDADGVVERINSVADVVRFSGGFVVFVQHDGQLGVEKLDPSTPQGEGYSC